MLGGMETPTSGEITLGHNVLADYFAQDQYKVLDPTPKMLEDISWRRTQGPHRSSCARCSAASCSPATTSSRRSACSPAASATATRWRRCSFRPRTCCCSTSRRTTSTCARRTFCSTPSKDFTGTVLFVSHDRYFIDGLATRVFEVEDKRVHIYPGDYEDYLFRKTGIPTGAEEVAAILRTETATGARIDAATGMLKPVAQVGAIQLSRSAEPPESPKAAETLIITSQDFDAEPWESTHELEGSLASVTPAPKHTAKRLNPIKLKQMEDRVAAIEDELSDLDARIAQAEQQQAVFSTAEAARALAAELETLREQHTTRTVEWEELASQLEEQTTA